MAFIVTKPAKHGTKETLLSSLKLKRLVDLIFVKTSLKMAHKQGRCAFDNATLKTSKPWLPLDDCAS